MDWNRIEGRWRQLKGEALQRWAKLDDDDWNRIAGKREELVGTVQELYGTKWDEAEREVEEWTRAISVVDSMPPRAARR